jgi:hypothetical protein
VTTNVSPTRALELLIGRARVAVSVNIIARVMAVEYGPLPLAHRLVVGVAFDDRRTIVCVSLTPARASSDSAKVVLFETAGTVGYGLCIDQALDLVDVTRIERGTAQPSLPRWVRRARTSNGRTLGWIDADVLIDDLSTGEVRP